MLESYASGFAEAYGLREGLILSGICAATIEEKTGLGTGELRKRYFYLSGMQIYRALKNLDAAGAVEAERINGFSRALRNKASGRAVRQYLQDISGALKPPFQNARRAKDAKKAGGGA
jgi:hypothetical protein